MSDGPHRSLKMRPNWKKVAEFADNCAFEPEQISEAVIPSVAEDWRKDVPEVLRKGVCDVLEQRQDNLFSNQRAEDLEKLRPLTVGHEPSQVVLDCAIQEATNGSSGDNAAIQAVENALRILAARSARQIEEHYLRESSSRRAAKVRSRIEQGIDRASFRDLSRKLLNSSPRFIPRSPSKHTGLDDGVRI